MRVMFPSLVTAVMMISGPALAREGDATVIINNGVATVSFTQVISYCDPPNLNTGVWACHNNCGNLYLAAMRYCASGSQMTDQDRIECYEAAQTAVDQCDAVCNAPCIE